VAFTIACGDVMPGCTAEFEAESEHELLELVTVHAASAHTEVDLTDDDVVAAVAAVIRAA
jgi:predicted small metal-binding protein